MAFTTLASLRWIGAQRPLKHSATAAALRPSERVMTRRGLHGNPAQIRELSDSRLPAETSKAAALHATEGHLRFVVNGRPVDMADARFDAPCDIHRARYITAEHRRRQPIFV